MRLWKRVDGEPYMINPRLGVLALQALNPKGRTTMAKSKSGARHMAWVRSFRKKNYRTRHYKSNRRRKHNPYPLAGTVAALANYRRRRHYRKHNPYSLSGATAKLGLPGIEQVGYGALGFMGTAMIQGFVDTLMPTTMNASSSQVAKYGEIVVSIVLTSMAAKALFGGSAAALAGVGGGIFLMTQAAHDFIPGVIPGMHAYTPLRAYTPVRASSTMGSMRAIVESAGGNFPQLATRDGMPQLATMDQGFKLSAKYAADGAMNVVQERFRRF